MGNCFSIHEEDDDSGAQTGKRVKGGVKSGADFPPGSKTSDPGATGGGKKKKPPPQKQGGTGRGAKPRVDDEASRDGKALDGMSAVNGGSAGSVAGAGKASGSLGAGRPSGSNPVIKSSGSDTVVKSSGSDAALKSTGSDVVLKSSGSDRGGLSSGSEGAVRSSGSEGGLESSSPSPGVGSGAGAGSSKGSSAKASSRSTQPLNSGLSTELDSGPLSGAGPKAEPALVASEEELQAAVGSSNQVMRKFSYRELQKVTRNFSKKLGEGGFGSVYKGWIPLPKDGGQLTVAVKTLDPESHQGAQEWQAEVEHLATLRHKHVVRLLGCCQEKEHWMLVYEFVPYGSFDYHLFSTNRAPPTFAERVKVALHAAQGMKYLHESNVIYRDFKTSNILVDKEFNAKLADFGLARAGPVEGATHVSTMIKGTSCYIAPEYISSGHLTEKCDVYSFGVVLLELLSGRAAFLFHSDSGEWPWSGRLLEHAHKIWPQKSRHSELEDPRFKDEPGGGPSKKALKILLQVAMFCIDRHPAMRPEMKTVVDSLSVAHSLSTKG